MKKITSLSFILTCLLFNISILMAKNNLNAASFSASSFLRKAIEMERSKNYYLASAFVKEYLSRGGRINLRVDALIDKLALNVGAGQFVSVPFKVLNLYDFALINYIKAKKAFRLNQFKKAYSYLNLNIFKNHPIQPFAQLMQASILSINGKSIKANIIFNQCIENSKKYLSKQYSAKYKRQLNLNLQNCQAGVARNFFSISKYEQAMQAYNKIDKSSFIWPELLIEEAWTYFYLKNYNSALGKLVTYKAPLFKFIDNPEIYVLRSLSFNKLCLYNDSSQVYNNFLKHYSTKHRYLRSLLAKYKHNYRFFYLLFNKYLLHKKASKYLISKLSGISIDPVFVELQDSLKSGKQEYVRILKSSINKRTKKEYLLVLKDTILFQRNLIGAYVEKELRNLVNSIQKARNEMSFIHLSELSAKKNLVYKNFDIGLNVKETRERGNEMHLKRNSKQYLWNFNGEFWADELGDYVFTLKSMCGDSFE